MFRSLRPSLLTRLLSFACMMLIAAVAPISAQEYFYIDRYHVDLKLDEDGSYRVSERIVVQFNEPRHGLLRDIPLSYRVDPDDSGVFMDRFFAHDLFIDDIQVKHFKFETQSLGIGVRIKIGDPDIYVEGQQIYEISYRIRNGLLHKKGITELYWNLIGDSWIEEIRHASFRVEIPSKIPVTENDIEVKTGVYGSTAEDVRFGFANGVLEGEATVPLGRNQGMTVAIRMPEGYVAKYPEYKLWIYHLKFLLLPFLILASFLYFWWRHGRDTKLADVVAYLPPKDMDPALAGYAIDIKANRHDAFSLIPYFGSRGYLKLEHEEKKGFFAEDEMTFTKLKDLPVDAPPHQKLFFEGLFSSGNSVQLSSLKNKFYVSLNATLSAIRDEVMRSDYFTRQSVKLYWNAIWIIILVGLGNSVYCFFNGRFIFLGITILASAVLLAITFLLLKRSQRGDERFKDIKGFRKFIRLAEQDKLKFLSQEDPSYFDKTLPYAVAFDCLDEWCDKFKGLEIPPPRWYASNVPYYNTMQGFNMSQFSKSMNSSLSEMRSVMSSQPSSSGSSGGGSSSGGGFGGGGGSSW